MPVTDSTVAKFWALFTKVAAELRAVPPEELGRSKLYGQVSDQLAKCHNRLKPELDTAKENENWTLVITADGEERLFKFVEQVVAAAPPVPGWKVRAFRSRADVGNSKITFGPHEISGEDIFATVAPAEPGRLTVTLLVRGLAENPGCGRAAEILFQHAVGEYDAVKVLHVPQLAPLPDPIPPGAVPLGELPAAVDRALGRPTG